jgi:hypothetical protein
MISPHSLFNLCQYENDGCSKFEDGKSYAGMVVQGIGDEIDEIRKSEIDE